MAKQVVKRYQKQVPGHHVQIDVKFLAFPGSIKRYQYTAVDDATRVRALKVYQRHTQANVIKFVDYIQAQFPFRIRMIRTDNGHEFQAQFHWHLKDLGIDHVYIKPHSPRLNGKVERSHRTDEAEFYQLLEYKGDVDPRGRVFPSGSSITTYTGLTPPTGEERPLKSYMRNSKARLMYLKVRPNNNLEHRRNFCQAIFGLLQLRSC